MSGLPEGMANGPSRSEHLEKDAQIWERPWTLEEMRQNSANWSLAADSGVSQEDPPQLWNGAKKQKMYVLFGELKVIPQAILS